MMNINVTLAKGILDYCIMNFVLHEMKAQAFIYKSLTH